MKIVFFICTLGHGRGGHFYDLKAIAECLSEHLEIVVIDIGLLKSPVIDEISCKKYFVYHTGFNYFKTILEVSRILKKEKPDVIHSFDQRTFYIPYIFSIIRSIPIVFTKCGGPNPTSIFPKTKNMIVVSGEDSDFFKNHKKYQKSRIHLLPNRVNSSAPDLERIVKLKEKIDSNYFIFLRIARITKTYEYSFKQSIKMVDSLNKDGLRCKLLIVGVIEDRMLYDELKYNKYLHITSDEEFTKNASDLIDISDAVIGTGRGLMEAASFGKILLAPVVGSDYPVLLTESNFNNLLEKNFSERSMIDNYDEINNYQSIKSIILDKDFSNDCMQFSKKIFENYFHTSTVIDNYINLYNESCCENKIDITGTAFNLYLTTRIFFSTRVKRYSSSKTI